MDLALPFYDPFHYYPFRNLTRIFDPTPIPLYPYDYYKVSKYTREVIVDRPAIPLYPFDYYKFRKVTVRVEHLPPAPIMMRSVAPEIPSRVPKIIRLTLEQEAVLLEQFNRWPKIPMHADIVLLAAETGLSEEDVHDWYTLRLTRLRKEQGLGGNFGLVN
ncbi:uncharacterized protein LOC122502997 [Leptopilina heterotoma]|uniref:uncharacterized protein LOC122502997 n=1 Tax=Leptopilina heterotoma TaxID=63436 RepID=UPI001CA91766|nr:uncharacterized protein LOC122502997 [Leptopilina heterotoma]